MSKVFRLVKLGTAAFAAYKMYEAWRGNQKGAAGGRDSAGPGSYR